MRSSVPSFFPSANSLPLSRGPACSCWLPQNLASYTFWRSCPPRSPCEIKWAGALLA